MLNLKLCLGSERLWVWIGGPTWIPTPQIIEMPWCSIGASRYASSHIVENWFNQYSFRIQAKKPFDYGSIYDPIGSVYC